MVCSVRELVAVVAEPVCENDVLCTDNRIVTYCLVKYRLVDNHIGLFTFDKHCRLRIGSYDHDICSLGCSVQRYGKLFDDGEWLHVAVDDEILDNVSAYPLFGCQYQIFAT